MRLIVFKFYKLFLVDRGTKKQKVGASERNCGVAHQSNGKKEARASRGAIEGRKSRHVSFMNILFELGKIANN
jgi:hypothetical protein